MSEKNIVVVVRTSLAALSASLFLSCASMAPADFGASSAKLDPVAFFEGTTRSWGVIENRRGNPTSEFHADLQGTREGDELVIEQKFTFEGDRKQTRVWKIRKVGEQQFEATADDVVGISRGEMRGNVVRWNYTTEGKRTWFIDDLDYSLWMYLMEDGETLINRVTITKFGVVVARTTEQFRRVDK